MFYVIHCSLFLRFSTPFNSFQSYFIDPISDFYTFLLDLFPEPYLASLFDCHPFHFSKMLLCILCTFSLRNLFLCLQLILLFEYWQILRSRSDWHTLQGMFLGLRPSFQMVSIWMFCIKIGSNYLSLKYYFPFLFYYFVAGRGSLPGPECGLLSNTWK